MPEHQQIQQSKKPNTIFQKQSTPIIQTSASNPYFIIQRAKINPKSLTHADVMQLQRTIGNQAVGRLLTGIGNTSTAQQATVQRQEIPEEEEPLQGKMIKTIQRQEIPEEEEPLQGRFENKPEIACPSCFAAPIVQKQEIPEEEEPLQGKMIGTVQRQEIPEEEPLQGKMAETVQRQEIPEEEPLQTKRENNTGMPDNLKAGVESLSGIDMSDVRVHYNSDKPADAGALAYTQGTNIHVAPGQEKHLPHEAWHVVQQSQGRVKPTMQLKDGIPVNNDERLEHEADVMGTTAFMSGQDIFFQQEAYQLGSHKGQEFTANELTHVVQQMSMPLHHAHSQTEEPEIVRIWPKNNVLQRQNNKPKRPDDILGSEKDALEKAVRENRPDDFKILAEVLFKRNPVYYRKLENYKIKKHRENSPKRHIWLNNSPIPKIGFNVTQSELSRARSIQVPPEPQVQKQGNDNQCGPASVVNILHLLKKKGVTLGDLQTKVAMRILARDPNFLQMAELHGIQVNRVDEIRRQNGALGEGMVMSAYYATELPFVLDLYDVPSVAAYEQGNSLIQSLSRASEDKPVILLHQGHFTLCSNAEPWTPDRDPWNRWDKSAKLEFMDSWGPSPDIQQGMIYMKRKKGIGLWYNGYWITKAWVVKVT